MNATTQLDENTTGTDFSTNGLPPITASLSTDLLLRAIEEANENAAILQKQIDELQRRLVSTQEEIRILTKLIDLRSGKALGGPINEALSTAPAKPLETVSIAKSGHNALETVIAILEEANRPVHISDLMRLIGEKNVQIPGSGTQANLISHLRRDKRIVRPSRGMYGLVVWGLTEMPSQSKRRRKRRRAR